MTQAILALLITLTVFAFLGLIVFMWTISPFLPSFIGVFVVIYLSLTT